MNDNVVELRQPEPPLAGEDEPHLDFDDMQVSVDREDGWVYIEDKLDALAVVALSEDEAKQLRDWLVKVLPA